MTVIINRRSLPRRCLFNRQNARQHKPLKEEIEETNLILGETCNKIKLDFNFLK